MLRGISWGHYWISLFMLLAVYYGILYLLNIKTATKGQRQVIKGEPLAFIPPHENDLIEAIEVLIAQAKENQSSLPELFYALQQLLKNRSDVDVSIKIKIQNAIQSKMNELGMHGFEADELVRLWKP